MRELASKTIDGKKYEFEQFGAKHSLRIMARLTKIMGEPLAMAIGALSNKEKGASAKSILDRQIDGDILGKAVKALVERLDEDTVIDLMEELTAKSTLCDGKKIDFNAHYTGDIGHLFKVAYAALEVQYGNFFGGLIGKQK